MQKTMTGMAVGAGLALAAVCAVADTRYYPAEFGYVADDDGRMYTYVIYDTSEPVTPVATGASDVNAAGRAPAPLAQRAIGPPAYDDTAYDTGTPAEPIVAVRAPDVNEVFGRA